MKTQKLIHAAALGLLVASTVTFIACSDSNAVVENLDAGGSSGSSGDAGQITFDAGLDDAGNPKDCFDNPVGHYQIINACTNADRIVRTPTSTKILADGGVPAP